MIPFHEFTVNRFFWTPDEFIQGTVDFLEWTTRDRATFHTRNSNFFLLLPFPSPLFLFPPTCAPQARSPLHWGQLPVLTSPSLDYHPLVLTTPGCSKNPNTDTKKIKNSVFSLKAISQSMLYLLYRWGFNNNLIFRIEHVSTASLPSWGWHSF